MATKVDLKKEYQELYKAGKNPALVRVPAFNYLALDGRGDPNTSPQYAVAVEALFGLAYTLKFRLKKGPEALDYVVMPLEGQWWAEDMDKFAETPKSEWFWTMSILQPPEITPDHLERAREEVRQKKNPAALDQVRLESVEDGLSAQVLHLGSYADEGPTIERLHQFIHESGHELWGKHREIYLSDPRRAAPDKLKTIIRQPCRPQG